MAKPPSKSLYTLLNRLFDAQSSVSSAREDLTAASALPSSWTRTVALARASIELQDRITEALTLACEIVSEDGPDVLGSREMVVLVRRACELEHEVVKIAQEEKKELMMDGIPVLYGNVVRDDAMARAGSGLGLLGRAQSLVAAGFLAGPTYKAESVAAYDPSTKPHPLSTPLARFRLHRPLLPSTIPSTQRAFAEARCEIQQQYTWRPHRTALGAGVLALTGFNGFRNGDPALELVNLDAPPKKGRWNEWGIPVRLGLKGNDTEVCLDSGRRLVYIADDKRVKSYRWAEDTWAEARGAGAEPRTLPVHTLDAKGFDRAVMLRENGARLVRAGKAGIAVWSIDTLPTHGPEGTDVVGREMRSAASLFDDDDVEHSSGAPPTQTVVSAPALRDIRTWAALPADGNGAIVARASRNGVERVDLVATRLSGRYVGQGGVPNTIRTSKQDANGFVTTGSGAVRLYDARVPAPVLAVVHGKEDVEAGLYEHIGGHPFIIIGGTTSEQITVWDVRARRPLYELSTGNNEVSSMEWDAPRQTLYAATDCTYRTWLGTREGYRPARFDRMKRPSPDDEGSDEDEDEKKDLYKDDPWDAKSKCWPREAYHLEHSFGYPLDSGEHRIYRYKFTPGADPSVLPDYGDAKLGESIFQF
ncbi:hypothetical protein OF83DRAFT_1177712 [Amylostereum chailletii]|nr:hypothetical protein OF83DRAFT_1177712 [Amylostereum chailletii]